ncbi:3-isopropylmalate dehydratase small subunit [Limnobacter litoralis]|uniref:3-isopropylmalate dehydratase small subunit n=1 Tax=Limnobacter litoralis TaxID=481366 RepID=A0ABQ5YQW7_9BURK|nr:3-isopropylmalate dehydratase small subunit [Limnobacter litoralis]GLR26979.1 3-isopropylmalate dehydratase small subunit [Limnobacter litoralis]
MKKLNLFTGLVAPLDRSNVDTDALIPKQYIKSIRKSGFGPFLFDEWRYLDQGELDKDPASRQPNPEFVLNQPQYADATILLSRENFGCGSSREHAVWALENYGFRMVIATSFADIFYGNCFKNGVLPIALPAAQIEILFQAVQAKPGYTLTLDLFSQLLLTPDGRDIHFEVEEGRKNRLIQGLDDIALTLTLADRIMRYEAQRKTTEPWLFASRQASQ